MSIDWNSSNIRPADIKESLLAMQMASDSSKDAFKTFKEGLKEHQSKVRSMNEAKLKEYILNGKDLDKVNSAEYQQGYEDLKKSMQGEYDLSKVLENKAQSLKYLAEKEESDRKRVHIKTANDNQDLLNRFIRHKQAGANIHLMTDEVREKYMEEDNKFYELLKENKIGIDTINQASEIALGYAKSFADIAYTQANTNTTLIGAQADLHFRNQQNMRDTATVNDQVGASMKAKNIEYTPPRITKFFSNLPTPAPVNTTPVAQPQEQQQQPVVPQQPQENAWTKFNKFYVDKGNMNPFPVYGSSQYGLLG